ncbi:hypothetical protein [Nocardia sp. R7R-8]|uniref:hypothetical protein n=1 Tax=Nocardia sp. R7R-8 TaxID=3459304 RepID=UPI00403E0746
MDGFSCGGRDRGALHRHVEVLADGVEAEAFSAVGKSGERHRPPVQLLIDLAAVLGRDGGGQNGLGELLGGDRPVERADALVGPFRPAEVDSGVYGDRGGVGVEDQPVLVAEVLDQVGQGFGCERRGATPQPGIGQRGRQLFERALVVDVQHPLACSRTVAGDHVVDRGVAGRFGVCGGVGGGPLREQHGGAVQHHFDQQMSHALRLGTWLMGW